MNSYFSSESLGFAGGVLRVRLVELLIGEPDGLIGRPVEVQEQSRRYEVVIEQVGHFQVRPEPMGGISGEATRLHDFLFRERSSRFLAEHAWGAENMAIPRLPMGVSVTHYVVYSETYVVDVLAAREPIVVELPGGAA